MRILVTGSAGFIGYKTTDKLLDDGHSVVGIDNINDYYDPLLKEWRLALLKERVNFEFITGDIADLKVLDRVFSHAQMDAVINLAARAGVRASVEDPWAYLDTNVRGTLNLLEYCKKHGVKKFVLASTSSIYGLNEMPFRETDRTDSPLAPYSATKKGAEALCYSYHYLSGLDISIPRYFTVYGPAGRPDMSIFKFIKNIDMGKPIPVFGDGRQKRDFTYVDDIAEGTIRCLEPCGYEIFNLGNDNSVELMYVINLIEKFLGKTAEIKWLPLHPADVKATWADISKTRKMLGWSPAIPIEEGVERTVNWYRENMDFVRGLREE